MRNALTRFWTDEAGAVTLDWVVLTGALVGTGLAVLGTVGGGVEDIGGDTAAVLEGYVVESSFGSDLCDGGIDAIQALENARVASGGSDAVDVTSHMETLGSTAAALAAEHRRLSELITGRNDPNWSRAKTLRAAIECEAVLQGIDLGI